MAKFTPEMCVAEGMSQQKSSRGERPSGDFQPSRCEGIGEVSVGGAGSGAAAALARAAGRCGTAGRRRARADTGCVAPVTPGPGDVSPRAQPRGIHAAAVMPVCIQAAFVCHLGVPKQGEGGGTGGEDETRDCAFPFSFELFPFFFFFLFFFSQKVSSLVRARSHDHLP